MKILLLAAALLAADPSYSPSAISSETIAIQAAHDLAEGREEAVASRFDERMAAAVSLDQLKGLMGPIQVEGGTLAGVDVITRSPVVLLRMRWSKGVANRLSVALAADGRISGLRIMPEDPAGASGAGTDTSRDAYQTKARLVPPFRGTWTAMNADRAASNPHFLVAAQRFAVDWLIVDERGSSHKGDGKSLSDYYAYGQEALATADGMVVTVVDGIPENTTVGEMDKCFVPGNVVVLDLGQGEFATYCHLIPGSMRVKAGDHVKAGQVLARVGNSGNTTEPHLHFQLADSARMSNAHGLPAQFRNVVADGKKTETVWPVTGTRLTGPTAK